MPTPPLHSLPRDRLDALCRTRYNAVVIGVSTGGLDALLIILPALPRDYPLPVLVVQHMSPHADDYLAQRLNEACQVTVKEAEDKEAILPGVVYLAPPNYHLLVERDHTLALSVEPRVNFARPAVDPLFETAADAYGPELVGVVLTGANQDGGQGLRRIEERGGLALIQDPLTAVAQGMPRAALEATTHPVVLGLNAIGPFLCRLGDTLDATHP